LNSLGFAASVEVWEPLNTSSEKKEVKLVGGLYGVAIRNAFFGESMFSLAPSASELALIHLAKTLDAIGGLFIDCQFETPHLKSMGGKHISYDKYMEILNKQELC
jgi:leucyl/phenylalanyl-tRNA--protein transferase